MLLLTFLSPGVPTARAESGIVVPDTLEADPGTISGTVGALDSSDDVRATISEEDVTAADTILALVPDGDIVPNDWDQFGAICVPGHHCSLVPIDDNTTFLSTTVLAERENVSISNFPATDIIIGAIRTYVWARENTTDPANHIDVTAFTSAACRQSFTISPIQLTPAYANHTDTWFGPAECLTIAAVEGAVLWFDSSDTVGMTGQAVTAVGFTVEYTDSDFQVVAYVNFSGVRGVTHVLRYEGSTSLTDSTGLELQVLRGATWLTIVSDFLGASESSELLTLNNGGQDVSEGRARFRIVDTELDEEAGESFSLDEFVIIWDDQQPPPPPGGDVAKALKLSCEVRFAEIPCKVILSELVLGVKIVQTRWSIALADGRALEFAGIGSLVGDREQRFAFPVFGLLKTAYTVSVKVFLDNNQSLDVVRTVVHDNTWVLLVISLAAVMIISAVVVRAAMRGRRRKESKRGSPGGEKNYRSALWEGP